MVARREWLAGHFLYSSGVEVIKRIQGDKTLHFILNHNDTLQTIHLESSYMNLLDREQLKGDVQLKPLDVLILVSSNSERQTL